MHSAALRELGLGDEYSYEAIEVDPDGFAAFVRRMEAEGFAGANVTIPHKETALLAADDASPAAEQIGAANTLSFSGGRIAAENTDAVGLIAALGAAGFDPAGSRALVLGAGGAGRAAAWALNDAGAEVVVANRTRERAARLAAEFGVEPAGLGERRLSEFDLLVNTTAVGLGARKDSPGDGVDLKKIGLGADDLHDRLMVVDMAYGPAETELVAAATARGLRVIDGTEILVRQGAASFEIWTGAAPPLETMRQAVSGWN